MNKLLSVFTIVLSAFLLFCSGCGAPADKKGQSFIKAEVSDVYDAGYTVRCTLAGDGIAVGSEISLGISAVSGELPPLEVGDSVRIVYDGVMETYPLQLQNVYAVYMLDENGEPII